MVKTEADPEGQKIKYFAAEISKPSDARIKFVQTLAEHAQFSKAMTGDEKAGKFAENKHQLMETAKKNSGSIAIGLGITALVLSIIGVCCCK